MKILVIADVHSNIDALERIWEQESDSDKIIFAGDLVDYGFFPGECIDWAIDKNIIAVSGNHDKNVLNIIDSGFVESYNSEEYTFAQHNALALLKHHIDYLKSLPETISTVIDGILYLIIHTFPFPDNNYRTVNNLSEFNRYWAEYENFDIPAASNMERRIILGHSHRRSVHILGDRELCLNPGSVSYRRNDDDLKGAEYITIENGKIYLKYLDYPREKLSDMVEKLPLTETEKNTGRFFYNN